MKMIAHGFNRGILRESCAESGKERHIYKVRDSTDEGILPPVPVELSQYPALGPSCRAGQQ